MVGLRWVWLLDRVEGFIVSEIQQPLGHSSLNTTAVCLNQISPSARSDTGELSRDSGGKGNAAFVTIWPMATYCGACLPSAEEVGKVLNAGIGPASPASARKAMTRADIAKVRDYPAHQVRSYAAGRPGKGPWGHR